MIACSMDRKGTVELLIEKGAALDVQNKYGSTGLMNACCKGHPEIVKLMIEKRVRLDVQNDLGFTALMAVTPT